jgi:calcium/calmodulin-dependent protein kinase (CaM kinase) II
MYTSVEQELIDLTQQLLDGIANGDWELYEHLCDAGLTAFEGESRGHLVAGLPFHKYYFDLERPATPSHTTICAPHVRLLGQDAAVVSYIRLVQQIGRDGVPETQRCEETRIWQRQHGQWRHVHFHRSSTD